MTEIIMLIFTTCMAADDSAQCNKDLTYCMENYMGHNMGMFEERMTEAERILLPYQVKWCEERSVPKTAY